MKGEIVSVDAGGTATLMAAECGSVRFGAKSCAPGYIPKDGDRVRACVSNEPPGPAGGRRGGIPGGGGYKARFVTGIKHIAPASDEDLLAGAVMAALRKADEAKCESVALPAISSGKFGFPLPRCAHILVKSGTAFAKEGPKFVKRVAFTNNDAPTVAAFVNEFSSAFGAESIAAEAAAAAAGHQPTNRKGVALTGPLLIDVDAQGNVIAKAPCPKTTAANVAKMKAEGYAFHSSGPFRNNWVRGMPGGLNMTQMRARAFSSCCACTVCQVRLPRSACLPLRLASLEPSSLVLPTLSSFLSSSFLVAGRGSAQPT